MKWKYWISLYLYTHCTARGLRVKTIKAYHDSLQGFREFVRFRLEEKDPDALGASDILVYVNYLRNERANRDSAVNRQVTILKCFYRAMVAMGHLEYRENPMLHFPKIKATPRKLPVTLHNEEVERLLDQPHPDTVLGIRDRTILALLYSTGIRASECAELKEGSVNLTEMSIQVTGKGGHQRCIPLRQEVVEIMRRYCEVRGPQKHTGSFFRSRNNRAMSRGAIYERVRTHARKARIEKRVSPHVLRHTFASHLVREGVSIVTIRDLLGHRMITSTQIYLHVTAEYMREAANRLPIAELVKHIEDLLPDTRLRFQTSRRNRYG